MDDIEDELLRALYDQIEILTDEAEFHELYGFYLEEYLTNRENFARYCRNLAEQIEKYVSNTGIAKTVGGSVSMLSGGAAIAGLLMAPVSGGASLTLTIGGIAGGIAGGGGNFVAELVKDHKIKSQIKKIEEALATFDDQEAVIFGLLRGVQRDFNLVQGNLRRGESSELETSFREGKSFRRKIKNLQKSARAAKKFAEFSKKMRSATCTAQGAKSASAAASSLVDEVAAPGFKMVITAGSTTAKLLSGAFAAVGIVMSIVDIASAVKDMQGSRMADAYRSFADEYDDYTDNLRSGIVRLSDLI